MFLRGCWEDSPGGRSLKRLLWSSPPLPSLSRQLPLFSLSQSFLKMCMGVLSVCRQSPEEGVRSPGTGFTDGWECYVGAGNRTEVLCKSFSLWNHLSCQGLWHFLLAYILRAKQWSSLYIFIHDHSHGSVACFNPPPSFPLSLPFQKRNLDPAFERKHDTFILPESGLCY